MKRLHSRRDSASVTVTKPDTTRVWAVAQKGPIAPVNVFKTLTNELPEQMLFRENGDSLELKTLDGIGNCLPLDLQNSGWSLINSQIA